MRGRNPSHGLEENKDYVRPLGPVGRTSVPGPGDGRGTEGPHTDKP